LIILHTENFELENLLILAAQSVGVSLPTEPPPPPAAPIAKKATSSKRVATNPAPKITKAMYFNGEKLKPSGQ
jgi:hypothetical protein